MLEQANVLAECQVRDCLRFALHARGCGSEQVEIGSSKLIAKESPDMKFNFPEKKKRLS
jgi:hypothetical protein